MSRELLKEAMPHLKEWALCIRNTIPEYERELAGIASLIDRIDAALAAPEPDAMGMVRQVRHGNVVAYAQNNDLLHATVEKQYTITDSEAAALIASYGRRVPKAYVSDIVIEMLKIGDKYWDMGGQAAVDPILQKIAAKYDVKLEG